MNTEIKITENTVTIGDDIYDLRVTPQPEAKEEWPKKGDTIYIINSYGIVVSNIWHGGVWDQAYKATGNLFRTQEEAKECKRTGWWAKRVAQETIDRFCRENGIENRFVAKQHNYNYFPVYNDSRIVLTNGSEWRYSTIFNVSAKSDADKIIAACESEIKLLLGVEETV